MMNAPHGSFLDSRTIRTGLAAFAVGDAAFGWLSQFWSSEVDLVQKTRVLPNGQAMRSRSSDLPTTKAVGLEC